MDKSMKIFFGVVLLFIAFAGAFKLFPISEMQLTEHLVEITLDFDPVMLTNCAKEIKQNAFVSIFASAPEDGKGPKISIETIGYVRNVNDELSVGVPTELLLPLVKLSEIKNASFSYEILDGKKGEWDNMVLHKVNLPFDASKVIGCEIDFEEGQLFLIKVEKADMEESPGREIYSIQGKFVRMNKANSKIKLQVPVESISILLDINSSSDDQRKLVFTPVEGVKEEEEPDVIIPFNLDLFSDTGPPLEYGQFIQFSLYAPNSEGKLKEMVNTYGRVERYDDQIVLLSVPSTEVPSIEEAKVTDGVKMVYHQIASKPTETQPPTVIDPEETTFPTPKAGSVLVQIPIDQLEYGISSLIQDESYKLVIIEKLAAIQVESDPTVTVVPNEAKEACGNLIGYMTAKSKGTVAKDVDGITTLLLEIPVEKGGDITKALTNSEAVYLLPINECK